MYSIHASICGSMYGINDRWGGGGGGGAGAAAGDGRGSRGWKERRFERDFAPIYK